jgi:hypothetical protein
MTKRKILFVGAMDRETKDLILYFDCKESEKLQQVYQRHINFCQIRGQLFHF